MDTKLKMKESSSLVIDAFISKAFKFLAFKRIT